MTANERCIDVGQEIGGKYLVERVLGQGGMGVVMVVRHIALGQPYAMKVMHQTLVDDPTATRRFLREAQIAASIRSEHAVRVFDVGLLPSGAPYMVMEYHEGMDLARVLRARGAVRIADAVRWILQACKAIGEAHTRGVLHRDIKPSNLLLTWDHQGEQRIKVLDFGISKCDEAKADGAASDLTHPGDLLGSPAYMAPERLRSQQDTPAADVWALGVVLYELITGSKPFSARGDIGTIARVLEMPPEPPSRYRPDLPAGLEGTILRCLDKDPMRRLGSVADLIQHLSPFIEEHALTAGSSPDRTVIIPTIAHINPLKKRPSAESETRFDGVSRAPRRLGRRKGLWAAACGLVISIGALSAAFRPLLSAYPARPSVLAASSVLDPLPQESKGETDNDAGAGRDEILQDAAPYPDSGAPAKQDAGRPAQQPVAKAQAPPSRIVGPYDHEGEAPRPPPSGEPRASPKDDPFGDSQK